MIVQHGTTNKSDIRGKAVMGFNFNLMIQCLKNSDGWDALGNFDIYEFIPDDIQVKAKLHRDDDVIVLFDDKLIHLSNFTTLFTKKFPSEQSSRTSFKISEDSEQITHLLPLPIKLHSTIQLTGKDYISLEVTTPHVSKVFLDDNGTGANEYFNNYHVLTSEIESDEIEVGIPIISDHLIDKNERLQRIILGNNVSSIMLNFNSKDSTNRALESFTLESDIFTKRDYHYENNAKNMLLFPDAETTGGWVDKLIYNTLIYHNEDVTLNKVVVQLDLDLDNLPNNPKIFYSTLFKEEGADQKALAEQEVRKASEVQRLGVNLPQSETEEINELKTALNSK